MKTKGIIMEDFTNYVKPSLFISTSHCDFKCCKECNSDICQNMPLVKEPTIEIDDHKLIDLYLNNGITNAIVIGGLEPMDTFDEVYNFIKLFRKEYGYTDDIVIYTGYYKHEIEEKINRLKGFDNIIVKFGRYVPGQKSHFDKVLGVYLANDEQYAEVL